MAGGNRNFGYRIAAARGAAGESQANLAAALGVKREMVNYWENGKRQIKADTIVEIAKRYGVSADYLLCNNDERTHDIQFLCDSTGLSSDALGRILDKEYSGRDEAIEALNSLLPGVNLFHTLSALAEYISSCQKVRELYRIKEAQAESANGEYLSNPSLLDAINREEIKMDIAELHAQKHFTYVLDEIRGRYLKDG